MAEGVAALSPDRVQVNPLPPPVLIERVRVDGKEVQVPGPSGNPAAAPVSAAARSRSLSIGPGRHVVEFRYSATSLIAPSKVRFQCRLEGVEVQWRQEKTSRSTMLVSGAPHVTHDMEQKAYRRVHCTSRVRPRLAHF